jgi:hypothetical protein
MEVEITPGVRVHAELEEELYTLRLVGDHSRYSFCSQDELPSTLAIVCGLDMNDPMTRRRILLATERIVSGR